MAYLFSPGLPDGAVSSGRGYGEPAPVWPREDHRFRSGGPDLAYADSGRVCGGEQAEEYQRDDYPGDSAEFPGGLVPAAVGPVAEEFPGSFPGGAGDADNPGCRRGIQHRLHRRDAAESPGPGLRPDRDEPDLYASGCDDYGAVTDLRDIMTDRQ